MSEAVSSRREAELGAGQVVGASVRTSVSVELIDAQHNVSQHVQALSATKLKLDNRELISISDDIGVLSVSEVLLRKNRLRAVPEGVFGMSNLQWLVLSDNRLAELDPRICLCTTLSRLLLAGNQLVRLPRDIGAMTQLKHLNVARNRLACLPVELARLTRLETLSIASNLLASLPVELNRLPDTTAFAFQGNLMRTPHTFDTPADARAWLFEHHGVISHIATIRHRATAIVVALQDLALPALVLVDILDAVFQHNDIRMAAKWDLVVAVKHFHDRNTKKN